MNPCGEILLDDRDIFYGPRVYDVHIGYRTNDGWEPGNLTTLGFHEPAEYWDTGTARGYV